MEPSVRVRLGEGTRSGLASIVQQYLEQDLSEFDTKRRRASRLSGRVALCAVDHDATVTLDFRGGEIVISDGARAPLDASIAGPYGVLVGLLQGEGHPLLEHLRGRLRVRASLRRPLFPLRVHALMKLPAQAGATRRSRVWPILVGLLAAAAAAAVLLVTS